MTKFRALLAAAFVTCLTFAAYTFPTQNAAAVEPGGPEVLPKNQVCAVTSIPMTNNAGTAPKVVVAEITVPLLAGQTVILSSKVQSRVLMTYNVGISGYIQVVLPDGTVEPVTRAMGYNSNINNVKYSINHGVAFYAATVDGDYVFQHLQWAYSTAYLTGNVVDISYCDQGGVVL